MRSAGRIETTPEVLDLFAASLGVDDRVVLEANVWEIARIVAPRVGRVIVASPGETGIGQARATTDRRDARAGEADLGGLAGCASLDGLCMPDEQTRAMRRRLARRSQLVKARTRAKNECHPVLVRRPITARARTMRGAATHVLVPLARSVCGYGLTCVPDRSG